MAWPNQVNPGLFIATTSILDPSRLHQIDVNSPEFKQLLVSLYQQVNNIALALNLKDSAYYAEEEFVNGQSFPPQDTTLGTSPEEGRQVFRKLIDFGPLNAGAGTTSVAHGIDMASVTTFNFTRIYGCASDLTGKSFLPLPYSSPVPADTIELNVDATNVNIITGKDRTAYTQIWVVLEYLKS